MWKLVLNDYRYNIKERFQKAWVESGFFMYLIWLVIPAVVSGYELYYYCCMLPIVIGALVSRMYAGIKNKTLFLCPMSEEQRKEYFKTAYTIRVGIGVAVFLTAVGSQVLAGRISFGLLVLIGAVTISFLLAINTYVPPVKNSNKMLEQDFSLPGHYEMWNIGIQMGGFVTMVTLMAAVADEDGIILNWEWGIIITLAAAYCIFAWRMVKKYFKPVMEQCISYERKR